MEGALMTRVLPLFIGATVLLSHGIARATTIYDSVDINPADLNSGSDPVAPNLAGPNAASFASGLPQILSSVSLELSADNPSDGGSLSVVLMPDNNGEPPYSFVAAPGAGLPTNGITTFTGATVLATLLDSSLSSTPSLVTINTSVPLAVGTYWIGLETTLVPDSISDPVAGTYGSAEWWWTYSDPNTAVGFEFNAIGGPYSFPAGAGPYEMIVDTSLTVPEPGTFSVLAGGLAGLGYIRRRTANKA